METQATRMTLGQKAMAVIMSIVLIVGLSPMAPFGATKAHADDTLVAAQPGQLATQATLADGTYKVTGLTTEVLNMYHFDQDSARAIVNGDNAWLVTTIDGSKEANTLNRFDGMAYGPQSKILDPSDTTNHTLVEGTPVAKVTETFDSTGAVATRTFILPVEKSVLENNGNIFYMIKYRDGYSDSHDGDWYKATGGDYYLDKYTLVKESDSTSLGTVDLKVSREAGIMFGAAETSTLDMNLSESAFDGTLYLAMTTDSFDKAFVGWDDDALVAEDEEIITPSERVFALPIQFTDGEAFIVTFHSKSKNAWYNKKFTVDAAAGTLYIASTDALEYVDGLIGDIYVQKRTDKTDAQCIEAKAAWEALSDEDKGLLKEADYFGRDTGDASKDDPLNADGIGLNEILVVSFGTSFNDSRVATIGGIEKAIAKAFPDWSVRRAFTAQIIINHIQARDGEKIDNMDQALERAVSNGVKNLVVAPTHLMHGAEYDELSGVLKAYESKMNITISEPLLGEKVSGDSSINADKEAVARALVDEAVSKAGFTSLEDAASETNSTAFVFMGHGTSHEANDSYHQMQAQMDALGYKNVFIGTVEGEELKDPICACSVVIDKVKAAGYKNVVLRPLMVVAGDHANNDMADPEDPESWYSQFRDSDAFESIKCQINGLGEIPAVQQIYVNHVKAVIPTPMAAVPTAAKGLTYIAKKVQTGVAGGTGYTLSGKPSATDAGTYTATATLKSGFVWSDDSTTPKTISWSIGKATATAKQSIKTRTLKAKNLKKKKATFIPIKVTTDGKVKYTVTKNTNKKAISINKKGKVTVKKGTAKGKYTLMVKVSAKKSNNYTELKAKKYTVKINVVK